MYSIGASSLIIKDNGKVIKKRGPINDFYPLRKIFKADEVIYVQGEKEIVLNIFSPSTWSLLLSSGLVAHSSNKCNNSYLFSEFAYSETEIPFCVIDIVFKDGKRLGFYKEPELFLSECKNSKVLEYLLVIGCKFKMTSTYCALDTYFNPNNPKFLDVIMQYPKALDKKWLKKNKQKILECVMALAVKGDYPTANIVGQLLIEGV